MKKLFSLVMAVILCVGLSVSVAETTASFSYEGPGSATPEEAVLLYLDALRNLNPQQMASAFAIESYARGYDFSAQMKRTSGYSYNVPIKLPNTNETFIRYNIESRRNAVYDSLYFQFMSMALPGMDVISPISLTTDEKLSAFLEQFENADITRFETIEHKEFLDPFELSPQFASSQNQENIAAMAAIYGADEMKSMAAQIEIGGEPHLFCCDVLRYGDLWYLSSLGGSIGMYMQIDYYAGGIMPMK